LADAARLGGTGRVASAGRLEKVPHMAKKPKRKKPSTSGGKDDSPTPASTWPELDRAVSAGDWSHHHFYRWLSSESKEVELWAQIRNLAREIVRAFSGENSKIFPNRTSDVILPP